MKRSILFAIIAALLIILTVSCGKNEVGQVRDPNKPVVVDITDEISVADDEYIDFLEEMEGFWVRPDGYEAKKEEPMAEISEFLVESSTDLWTPYFDGVAGQSLSCTADVDGLHLCDVEGEELVILAYNGESLLNDDGSVAYVRIMSVEERLELEKE